MAQTFARESPKDSDLARVIEASPVLPEAGRMRAAFRRG
jgi:hypothetical protein